MNWPTLADVKRRYPLAEMVARYVPNLKHTGAHLLGCCPFHPDRNPSFAVHLPTETWRCYSAACDCGGDVIDLVGRAHFGPSWNSRDKAMFKEALGLLTGNALPPLRQVIPATWRDARQWRPIEMTPRAQLVLHLAARLYHTTLLKLGSGPSSPQAYLQQRGFDRACLRAEGLGYASGELLGPALVVSGLSRAQAAELNLLTGQHHQREFLAGRIVFVDRDRQGRVLHLIGRAFAPWLSDEAPKYLSLKDLSKPLYGYARLDKRPSQRPVVLVESPPDAITARQWGWDALACVGAHLKEEHAVLLGRLRRPLLIVPHNDGGTGLGAAQRWLERIGHGHIALLPDAVKDLNELGQQPDGAAMFRELVQVAQSGQSEVP